MTNSASGALNQAERTYIEQCAQRMLDNDVIEWYLSLGKKDVCLERPSRKDRVIGVSLMNIPLSRNEANVTSFNKRKKVAHETE
jgi:hypothetical protein